MKDEDLYISAPIGSGKTTTSLICALNQIVETQDNTASQTNTPSVIILSPSREQAHHIIRTVKEICRFIPSPINIALCQNPYRLIEEAPASSVDLLVATPENLIDSIKEKTVFTRGVKSIIFTSADQMLDAGYWHEMDRIHQLLPSEHQSIILASNKQEGDLDEISRLFQNKPFRYATKPEDEADRFISERAHFADDFEHKKALLDFLVRDGEVSTAFVISNTTSCAKKLSAYLQKNSLPNTLVLGGDKLEIDADIAANERKYLPHIFIGTNDSIRKLDNTRASHIINFHFPRSPECYFSRQQYLSKKTRHPVVISLVSKSENKKLNLLESLIDKPLLHGIIPGLEPKSTQKQNKKGRYGRPQKGKNQSQKHTQQNEYSGFMRSNTRRTQNGTESNGQSNDTKPASTRTPPPKKQKPKQTTGNSTQNNQTRTPNYNHNKTDRTQSSYNAHYRETNYQEEWSNEKEKAQPVIKVQRKIKTADGDSGNIKPASKISRIAGKLGLSTKK
jgi:superfamily II DNA/RNA helicase